MDPDAVFLSYLAILAVVAIVLAVVEKRRSQQTRILSPAGYATLMVVFGFLPLQIYLAWEGESPTPLFFVLCALIDVAAWLLAYQLGKKRQTPSRDTSLLRRSGR